MSNISLSNAATTTEKEDDYQHMNPILRNFLLVIVIVATAFVTGISKSLVSEGAISIPIMILAITVMGGLIGLVMMGKPNRSSSMQRQTKGENSTAAGKDNGRLPESSEVPENPIAAKYSADEEWEILSKYDVEVSAAVHVVRVHGEAAIEELWNAHRVINDKSQLSRIASNIDKQFRDSIAEQFVQEKRRKNEMALTERQEVEREKKELRDLHGIWMLSKNEYICDGKVFKDRHKAITYSQRIERRKIDVIE